MTKHEELVEEIATTINKRMAVYHPKLGLVYGKIHKDTATKMAKSFITHILSAVRDGQLDEELGVVGRRTWPHQ